MEAWTPDGKILKRKNKEKNLKSQWVLEHPLSEFAKKEEEKVRKVIFCGNRLGILRFVPPVAKSNKKDRENSLNAMGTWKSIVKICKRKSILQQPIRGMEACTPDGRIWKTKHILIFFIYLNEDICWKNVDLVSGFEKEKVKIF